MSEQNEKSAEIDNLNIEPLSDEDLESVAGGLDGSCSCCHDHSGCSSPVPTDVA